MQELNTNRDNDIRIFCHKFLYDTVIGTFRIERHKNKTELDDFCILPPYQNKGYGIIALGLIEKTVDSDILSLSTPYFCTANRYLYTKAGYTETGTLHDETIVCFEKK